MEQDTSNNNNKELLTRLAGEGVGFSRAAETAVNIFNALVLPLCVFYCVFLMAPVSIKTLFVLWLPYIHIIGLLAFSFFIFTAARHLLSRRKQKMYLKTLSLAEKCFLRKFIYDKTKTVSADCRWGLPTQFVQMGFIERASTYSMGNFMFNYNIDPWLWAYLHKNKKNLDLSPDELNELSTFLERGQALPLIHESFSGHSLNLNYISNYDKAMAHKTARGGP